MERTPNIAIGAMKIQFIPDSSFVTTVSVWNDDTFATGE
jgi:hypothetical protein